MMSPSVMGHGREGQNDVCPVERGKPEEERVVRRRLICKAGLPTRAMVTSGPGLLLKTMSGSVALPQV